MGANTGAGVDVGVDVNGAGDADLDADVGAGGELVGDPRAAVWALERVVLEVVGWRMELEWRLVGAILRHPEAGVWRADEAGVTADLFEREDVMLIYLAVRAAAGMDKVGVLAMAMYVLKRYGYWRPDALPGERGMNWSERNLVDLANGADGPGEVAGYARQLIDLDRRLRAARALWRRVYRVLEGWGRADPQTRIPKPETRRNDRTTNRPATAATAATPATRVILRESGRPKDLGTAGAVRGPEILRCAQDDGS